MILENLFETAPRVDVGIDPYETEIVQGAAHRKDKVFRVSVISSGDPLQTALTQWERFCFAMDDLAKRNGWS